MLAAGSTLVDKAGPAKAEAVGAAESTVTAASGTISVIAKDFTFTRFPPFLMRYRSVRVASAASR